jgi:AcrR family transcriptional regulator
MEAAWEEFTAVRCSDASINKIIRSAGIPRGSFYQYFTDKDDLFLYLVRPLQNYFFDLARQEVERTQGNLFAAPLAIFDRFFQLGSSTNLIRCLKVIRCNPDSEFHSLFCAPDAPFTPSLSWWIPVTSNAPIPIISVKYSTCSSSLSLLPSLML